MRFLHSILFTMIMLSGLSVWANEILEQRTIVRLVDEYVVKDKETRSVTLGDLAATVSGPDEAVIDQMKEQVIVDAPKPGEVLRYGRHQVMFALRKAGFNHLQTSLEGSSLITIYGPGHRVSVQDMVSGIRDFVLQQTAWPQDELVLQVISTPNRDAWLPAGEYEMNVKPLSQIIHGNSRFEVEFYQNNIRVDALPFIVTVQHQRKVYIPIRDIQRGEVIQKEDLRELYQLVDSQQTDRMLVDNLEEMVGRRAKTTIRKGDPVKWFALETNFILKRGDLVQVIMKNGGMTLQTTGVMQQRAAVGDVVLLKASVTGKPMKGKVLSRHLVELVAS